MNSKEVPLYPTDLKVGDWCVVDGRVAQVNSIYNGEVDGVKLNPRDGGIVVSGWRVYPLTLVTLDATVFFTVLKARLREMQSIPLNWHGIEDNLRRYFNAACEGEQGAISDATVFIAGIEKAVQEVNSKTWDGVGIFNMR